MKKITALFLALILILPAGAAAQFSLDAEISAAAQYVEKAVPSPAVSSIGGEWAVIALARSGLDVPADIYYAYLKNLGAYLDECGGVLHSIKYTEYSRVSLALAALGKNPADFGGYNLLKPLADFDAVCRQGLNGPIWALIALDSGGFEIPENPDAAVLATRDIYIEEILKNMLPDGGWSLTGSAPCDADITAMALCALAPYADRADVQTALERALGYLSGVQNPDGGFSAGGIANSESCAQVLTALCALGISPEDGRFVKNSHTLAENLLSFQNPDGGFAHIPGGETNQMATEQALYTLTAMKRYCSGENRLYDMRDAEQLADISESGSTASVELRTANFADLDGCFAKAQICSLYERGIINGRTDTIFDPAAYVTRGEAAALCARALGLGGSDECIFSDLAPENPLTPAIGAAYRAGIASGISADTFSPDAYVTREQCAVFLAKSAAQCGIFTDYTNARDVLCIFDDYTACADWAASSLAFCVDNKIISDNADNIFPERSATRAEFALMLYNTLEKAGK